VSSHTYVMRSDARWVMSKAAAFRDTRVVLRDPRPATRERRQVLGQQLPAAPRGGLNVEVVCAESYFSFRPRLALMGGENSRANGQMRYRIGTEPVLPVRNSSARR
jgi:hypothetical protein